MLLSAGFAVTGSADHTLRVWPLDFASHFLEAEHEGAVTTVRDLAITPVRGTVTTVLAHSHTH